MRNNKATKINNLKNKFKKAKEKLKKKNLLPLT